MKANKSFRPLILGIICLVMYVILGYSLQSTKTIYETTGHIENVSVKDSGYVAIFYLRGNKTKFELRVPDEKGHLYLPKIKNGDKVRISYLKPFFWKASVVEFSSANLMIGKKEQIEIYKEDRSFYILVLLTFLVFTALLAIPLFINLCKSILRRPQHS